RPVRHPFPTRRSTDLAATLRWHIRPMAKIELSRVPLVGWLLGKAGVIYVDRGHADVKAVKEALTCLKAGGKMLVFPEGTRVHDGDRKSTRLNSSHVSI